MSHLYKFLSVVLLGVFAVLHKLDDATWAIWHKAHELFAEYRAARNRELRDQLAAAAHHFGEQLKEIAARRDALDAAETRAGLNYEAATTDITAALEELKEEVL